MSPQLTTFAGISVYPLGFTRGGAGDSFYIATVATGYTSYSCSAYQTALGLTTWSFYDQNGRHYWVTISRDGAIGTARAVVMYSYAYFQKNVITLDNGTTYASVMSPSFGPPQYLQPLKMNSSGSIVWQRWLGAFSNTQGAVMALDANENVYLTGYQPSSSSGAIFNVAKYNSSGSIQFQRNYYSSGLGFSRNDSIAVGTNAIYVGGGFSQQNYQQPAGVVKLDLNGNVGWAKNTYGVSPGSYVATDASDNVYVYRPNYLTKYNSSGTHQWTRYLNYSSQYMGITTDPTGNVYLVDGTTTVYVYKYNSNGVIQWQRSITRSGGNLVAGTNWSNGASPIISATNTSLAIACSDNSQAVLFKIPTDGSLNGTYTVGSLTYTIATSSNSESSSSEPYSSITVTAQNQSGTDGANNLSTTTSTASFTKKVIP
jgi:hypothetical protein